MSGNTGGARQAEEDILLREDKDGIARLTLNRPAAFNGLSTELLTRLREEIKRIGGDASVRVVVIAANGRGFCAGHDLREVRSNQDDRAYMKTLLDLCSQTMMSIVKCPKPVIARVHGIATAAGCQLVASCDLAVAEDGAMFGTPGVNIGLFCHTPMVALSRNVHRKHAMEMLLTGEMINADDAIRFGLINRTAPLADLDDTVDALASRIASKSSYTLAIGKEAFYNQLDKPNLAAAYEYAADVMVTNLAAQDAAEGIQAFLDKREPEWQDR